MNPPTTKELKEAWTTFAEAKAKVHSIRSEAFETPGKAFPIAVIGPAVEAMKDAYARFEELIRAVE